MEDMQDQNMEGAEEVVEEEQPLEAGAEEEQEQDEAEEEESEEEKPKKKAKPFNDNPRWRKLKEEVKSLKAENDKLRSELPEGEKKSWNNIKSWLLKDEKNIDLMEKLLLGKSINEEEEEDPWAEYEPKVAAQLRKADKLEKELQQLRHFLDQRDNQSAEERLQNNMSALENHFAQKLAEDGFVDKATGRPVNKQLLKVIEGAVLAELATTMEGDPRTATQAQLDAAYEAVVAGLSAGEKMGLKKALRPVNAPPSGSRTGVPVGGKKRIQSEAERLADIAAML